MSSILRDIDRERFLPSLLLWRNEVVYPLPEGIPVTIIEKHSPFDILRVVLKTRSLIRLAKPDIIYSHLSFVNLLTGLSLLLLKEVPVWIACEHSNPHLSIPATMRYVLAIMLRRADRVIGVSEGVSKAMVDTLSLTRQDYYSLQSFRPSRGYTSYQSRGACIQYSHNYSDGKP